MALPAKQEFYIRLSGEGDKVFADTAVRTMFLTSIKEVIRDSVKDLVSELSQRESVSDEELKVEIKVWLEVAKKLPIDILGVEDGNRGESVDELFLDFADVILLEGLKLLFIEHGLDSSIIEELESEQHASFHDLEDLVRLLANTSGPLALLAALAFNLVSPENITEIYGDGFTMEAVIGALFAQLDKMAETDEELAEAANNPEVIRHYLAGTSLNLDIVDAQTKEVAAHFQKSGDAVLGNETLALLWRMLDPSQKEAVKVAALAFAKGQRPTSLAGTINPHKDVLGG
jgi:hypothetical protein